MFPNAIMTRKGTDLLTHSACVLKGGYCKDDDCDKNAKNKFEDTQNNAHGCADTGQPELNEQGMMNRGDPEPYRQAWSGYPLHWYAKDSSILLPECDERTVHVENIWGTNNLHA